MTATPKQTGDGKAPVLLVISAPFQTKYICIACPKLYLQFQLSIRVLQVNHGMLYVIEVGFYSLNTGLASALPDWGDVTTTTTSQETICTCWKRMLYLGCSQANAGCPIAGHPQKARSLSGGASWGCDPAVAHMTHLHGFQCSDRNKLRPQDCNKQC